MVFYLTNLVSPVSQIGDMDEVDVYGTFTLKEAKKVGIISVSSVKGGMKSGGETISHETPVHQNTLPPE